MLPLNRLPPNSVRKLKGLLFDLDDTFLDDGQLHVEPLQALFELRKAGLHLIAVTGRPHSWGELLLRQWPLTAAVLENGRTAVYRAKRRVVTVDPVPEGERRARTQRLQALVAALHKRFPQLQPSDDSHGRRTDYAFDIAEHQTVEETVIDAVATAARQAGAHVIRSSIQLHISFDSADKASGSVHLLRTLLGHDPTEALFRFAYVGDSGNDAPCFAAFHHSIAVANLSGQQPILPRYQTRTPRSAGFCELAEYLIRARGESD